MRLTTPRVAPLDEADWNDEVREIMQPFVKQGRVFNIFRTLANHPELMRRWMVFANHILAKSSLGARDREILILRIGWLCRSGYEWGQHVVIGRESGLSDEDILRIQGGADAAGWSASEQALLRAVDELHADAHVSDSTWAALAADYSTEQMMDIVFTVGQYNLVSMALNSLGVQLDEGLPGFDLKV